MEKDETRLSLHKILCEVLESEHCYFVRPSKRISYPAIIYSFSGIETKKANNQIYFVRMRWNLQLITYDFDEELFKKILALPYCSFDRHYIADNLNHFTFTLYYNKEENTNA